jgi:hypothetical protein
MQSSPLSADRIADMLVVTLLLDALLEIASAFARTNRMAALLTIAAVERDLMARAEAFPALFVSPSFERATMDRVLTRIANAIGDVRRAADDITVQ